MGLAHVRTMGMGTAKTEPVVWSGSRSDDGGKSDLLFICTKGLTAPVTCWVK